MATYQVNAEMIALASGGVHKSIQTISAEVASLMAQLTNLQGSWTGAAATAFTQVAAQWQVTQKQVEESLAAINQALAAAGQTYTDAEDRAMSLFAAGH
jgi:WXG100 family type VII secretion target